MKYGLIGKVLGHSFSRSFFTNLFHEEGGGDVYENFELEHIEDLKEMLRTQPDLRGFNVTIPYKTQIIPLLDKLSAEAEVIGAVNVVKCFTSDKGEQQLVGYNTDCIGFTKSLTHFITIDKTQLNALVLGTGGVSKAVQYALKKMGIHCQLVSRAQDGCLSYADIDEAVMEKHQLIVNCTPLGMAPAIDTCPNIPYNLLTGEHWLFDCVYGDVPTLFLQRGRRFGAHIKDGTEMLKLQALAALDIWRS